MTRIDTDYFLSTEFRHDFTDSRIVNSRAPSGWSLVSRKGRKEREDSSADEWRTPTTHLLLRSNEPMKFAKAPRAYFAAFVQFAKQEDVNLHMKNLAPFASLREIKAFTPDGQHKLSVCVFVLECDLCSEKKYTLMR